MEGIELAGCRAWCCLQALAVISAFRTEWPALVVVPPTLRDTWADAAHEWLGLTDADISIVWREKDVGQVHNLYTQPALDSTCLFSS